MICSFDFDNDNVNDNDNENTLFDHNIQIEIAIYKQFNLDNQIINWSGDYY